VGNFPIGGRAATSWRQHVLGRFLRYHGRVMPRDLMSLTPDEFEALVTDHLKRLIRTAKLKNSAVNEKELLKGPDGEYEIDVVVRFEALDAEFVVLVECKRHKNPVKRELVQVLYDKRRPLGAHKCMMFSTSGYQSGAIEYASKNGVALIQVTSGSMTTLTRSETGLVPAGTPDFAAWRVLPSDNGHLESLTLLDEDNPDVLSDVLP
jgi:restriction system protein